MYEILTQCPLFRGLDSKQIESIIEGRGDFTVAQYKDGEYIARRDTAYSGLMIIVKGKAKGVMTYSSGKSVNVDTIEAPQLIAPAFLFGGYNRLPIDVIAQGDVEILTLHRGYIFELMQENTLILSNFIDIISNRADVWSKRIYFLSFRSLKEKVVSFLLHNTTEGNPSLAMPDIQQISEYFDATRSAVITVLDELSKHGMISVDGETITVIKRKALEDSIK